METETHVTDADIPLPVGSDSGVEFKPSAKLRTRIAKLARWRIESSDIIFPEYAWEFDGGHATVSRAMMKITGEPNFYRGLAVKKMRIADDTDLSRVLGLAIREAEYLAELNGHPNIVEFKGFVEDISKGIIWLLFPWASNGNLKDFVAQLDWEIPERIWLIDDVVRGLEYLHRQEPPICHGDLKSLNVVIDRHCCAAITDFGSARRLSQRDQNMQTKDVRNQPESAQSINASFCASNNTITLTGNKYSLRWAAPELLMEDQLSLWSDIWALGWIVYEVMTNSLPFHDASTDIAIVKRVLRGDLPSLAENADLSLMHELCSLMTMCWSINPTERPTADYCGNFIMKLPMFVPTVTEGRRYFTRDRLSMLRQMYESRGEYAKTYSPSIGAPTMGWRPWRQDPVSTLRIGSTRYKIRIKPNEDMWPKFPDREIQEKRIAKALSDPAEECRLKHRYDEAIKPYSEAMLEYMKILKGEMVGNRRLGPL